MGHKALELLEEYGTDISLILLDLVMPVMDGYTFLSIVKPNPDYSSIPIIVTTQNDTETDEVAALAKGATDFVVKPYNPQILLHRVASMIHLRENAAIVNLLQYDKLTGLYNKEFFLQKARDTILRNQGKRYDLICSDVENFKLINDIFGISVGDAVLKGIAKILRKAVGEYGLCGRLQGDQFVCLIPHQEAYDEKLFIDANEQINQLLEMTNILTKWGIFLIEDDSLSLEQMCDRALLAARSIKGKYGKPVVQYDDKLRDKLLREQNITDSMEAALANDQFQVYLQPKYRIKDECLIGAEALVRWEHPEWGIQPPGEFIPIFEKNGFITKLDQYVWEKACSIMRDWDDRGLPPISVSVNVSRADIYNADIADILMDIIHRYGLEPHRLHLEITESVYARNPEIIIDSVSHLKELGFIIEMDDFGSGYSSLNMLNEMPIDILKLDMKFIQNETIKASSQGILQFIICLARWMRLTVVAEGVETKEQLNYLEKIGCDYVQGYYFAKPMPHREFESLMSQYNEELQVLEDPNSLDFLKKLPVVLIADEDATYRHDVAEKFINHFSVVEAKDSRETLNYLENHTVSALILSLDLPDDQGFAVLEKIQRRRELWHFPTIVTSESDMELEARALEMGADDYIAKPHLLESLAKRVQRAIGIAANRKRIQLISDAAYQDPLTGLINREGLTAVLDSVEEHELPLAIFLLEVDLPDSDGDNRHRRGEQILVAFTNVLRKNMRETDALARISANRFMIISKQILSEEIVWQEGNRFCIEFRQDCANLGISINCRIGIGIMQQGDSTAAAVSYAEQALDQLKNQCEDNCRLWKNDKRGK